MYKHPSMKHLGPNDSLTSDFSPEESEIRFNALVKALGRVPLNADEKVALADMDRIYNGPESKTHHKKYRGRK